MGSKKKNQNRSFLDIYDGLRREWPVGIKPYTRVFKDKRKEQKDARLNKKDLMNYES